VMPWPVWVEELAERRCIAANWNCQQRRLSRVPTRGHRQHSVTATVYGYNQGICKRSRGFDCVGRFRKDSDLANITFHKMTAKGLDAVLVKSEEVDSNAERVIGPDFNLPLDLQQLLQSYGTIGYQATAFKQAIDIVNKMVFSQRTGLNAASSVPSANGDCRTKPGRRTTTPTKRRGGTPSATSCSASRPT
jgi:hypothetical protein